MWRNTESGYGAVSIVLHWSVAAAVFGLFGLGLWMVELTYYDDWYNRAPDIHRGIGVLLFLALGARLLWRLIDPPPRPEPGLSRLELRASAIVHVLLYVLLFATLLSGYLISTAKGQPIDVFGLFSLPATLSGLPNQAETAGDFHLGLAIALISLTGLHALAALKHHVLDRDRTLTRMLGRRAR